jgi:hypothetical protein
MKGKFDASRADKFTAGDFKGKSDNLKGGKDKFGGNNKDGKNFHQGVTKKISKSGGGGGARP